MQLRTTAWHFLAGLILLPVSAVAWAESCAGPETLCEPLAQITPSPGALATDQVVLRSGKVATALRHALAARQQRGPSPLSAEATSSGLSTSGVQVNLAAEAQVYVELVEFRQEHVARLEGHGLRVDVTLPQFRLVQGWLPLSAVDAVAARDFVKEVRPPDYGVRNGTGAASTAGETVLRADLARQVFRVSGAGVMVGVLSNGVESLVESQNSGDLPFVEVLDTGSGNEGTALLEIIHDLAPGAALAFWGPATSAEMVQAINALRDIGARVLVDDIGWVGEPKFQDGMVAQTIRAFAQDGRVYVGAAGNSAQSHYRAGYKPSGLTGVAWPAAHNFRASGTDIGNNISIAAGCSALVVLQWSNPWGAASDDFDIIIARSTDGLILFNTSDRQTGTQNPIEAITLRNNGTSAIVVAVVVGEFKRVSPPASLVLDYFVFGGCGPQEYATASQSVLGSNAVGEMLSVAAVHASAPTVAAPYSSVGPHDIYFPAFEQRAVPNITATDCVATHAAGFNPFCGTSAAAPHVAAIAALLLEAAPALTSQQSREILTGTAIDLGAAGFDATYGGGRIDAYNALNAASPAFAELLSNGASFRSGQTAILTLYVRNPAEGPPLDLYVGAIFPDGNSIAFLVTPNVFGGLGQLSAPASVVPFARAGAGYTLGGLPVLSFTFPATGIPAGTYKVFAALSRQGALGDNVINNGDLVWLSVTDVAYSP